MLADPGDIKQIEMYINDDRYAFEPKVDGNRVLFVITNGIPKAFNRSGEPFKNRISPQLLSELTGEQWGTGTWVLDGEYMDSESIYYLFDIPAVSADIPLDTFDQRRAVLEFLVTQHSFFHIRLLPCVTTSTGKRDMYEKVLAAHGEGIMVKDRSGGYTPGLRNPVWLKLKNWKTVDVVVTELWREGKRSIAIGIYRDGTLVDVGSCTMTERNLARIQVGNVVELKYLYLGAGDRLFQPAFIRVRRDKTAEECTFDQLVPVNKEVML